ncbi:heme exporter protein CcmD [Roseicitreum antarcticum]|uniref:Heme exporter protein D n=1 Tax=Roseicitreum antarcticum TaxID=564137 RepID=A0A1H3C973_9RHOB|nr:heme exporter protein CcmD [Roseicitreum antarcticum]SDX50458.1 Heme exporter protein D (CcmD) [Roseicitreum antarcticum]
MMPDLGRYAFEVTMAYAVSLALVAALVALIWARAARVRRQLDDMENRMKVGPNG